MKIKIVGIKYEQPGRKGQTVYGYGVAVPTHRMVKLDVDHRWRRVYCTICSNIGTCWVRVRGRKHVVDGVGCNPDLWTIDPNPWGR